MEWNIVLSIEGPHEQDEVMNRYVRPYFRICHDGWVNFNYLKTVPQPLPAPSLATVLLENRFHSWICVIMRIRSPILTQNGIKPNLMSSSMANFSAAPRRLSLSSDSMYRILTRPMEINDNESPMHIRLIWNAHQSAQPSRHSNAPDPSNRLPVVHWSPNPENRAYAHESAESLACVLPANILASTHLPWSESRRHLHSHRQCAKTSQANQSFCPANSWQSSPIRCRPATRPVWKNFNYLVHPK